MDVKAATTLSLHPDTDKAKTLRKAAEGFEELFLTQFLKAARAEPMRAVLCSLENAEASGKRVKDLIRRSFRPRFQGQP